MMRSATAVGRRLESTPSVEDVLDLCLVTARALGPGIEDGPNLRRPPTAYAIEHFHHRGRAPPASLTGRGAEGMEPRGLCPAGFGLSFTQQPPMRIPCFSSQA
jgi:hypothetical protein